MLVVSPRSYYDVIVVGGGHAGIEAALASSRLGTSTLLVVLNTKAIGRMSCNPAIGGTAKGHMVREIDALGGEMGKIADATGVHFRILNKSKGPAVWSLRSQNDREWYSLEAQRRVFSPVGLDVIEDSLEDILVDGGVLRSAVSARGTFIRCKSLVICAGTFLNGIMHTGLRNRAGGRFGEPPVRRVTQRLVELGFVFGRLKTGTPPRVDLRSINLDSVERQESDDPPTPFSFSNERITNRMIPMYLTHTNPRTHEILVKGFDRSPMFSGRIKARGPRYCPSIEDKIHRFADRDRHQIFLEPEGYDTNVVYVNGFSTSLPEEIQFEGLRSISGLENVKMLRPGYAVEYDFFPPSQLRHTLETKLISGLFFAGQINGTSGYEEAAGQGLIAGINASLKAQGKDEFFLRRSESYIGVMIDDLINKSTDEPYRMFTSRAEHRLILRQDNADRRLMPKGHEIGLTSNEAMGKLRQKEAAISAASRYFQETFVPVRTANELLRRKGLPTTDETERLSQILKRPTVSISEMLQIIPPKISTELLSDSSVREQVEIDLKYDGYIKRELEQIARFSKYESYEIPTDFDFLGVKSISTEGRERLHKVRPRSIGQAARISGVTTSDISVLTVLLRK